MTESRQLLAEFVQRGSEDAFRELVKRYINLVYATALRLVAGNRASAEDVTQTVFLHLSRNAHRITGDVMLGGWLHRDTCHVASNYVRAERRRQARELEVALMDSAPDHTQANLSQVTPLLDEAIDALSAEDRAAILLRFFECLDFHGLGAALGSSEDAARMRVTRALEKLRDMLSRRGVALSTAALTTLLAGEAATAAPSGLAASVAASALAGSAVVGASIPTVIKAITMTKIKAGIIAALVAGGAAIPLWIQHQDQVRSREENRTLREQIQQLTAENQQLSNQVAASAAAPTDPDKERELLRLRSEVGSLRQQVVEAAKASPKKTAQVTRPEQVTLTPEEYQLQAGVAKMNYTKGWMLAFFMYSQQNQGRLPERFDQAEPFLPAELKTEHNPATTNDSGSGQPKFGLTPDRFEVLYRGSLAALDTPQSTIVVREKEPWQTLDGGWVRAYAFADGHSEIHKAPDGNFAPWEAQHVFVPPAPVQPGQ